MSWSTILGLAAGAFAFKYFGLFILARLGLDGAMLHLVQLLPAALLGALVALGVFDNGDTHTVLTRLAGVAVGAVAAWRRAPLVVVLVAAAAVTAALRAAT
ncbi:MAG: AzlD domain-containing protein [Microthrixaceae bacterium]|nr:AzlD domain-containing protein [Microthrixaceae bacterium]